MKKFTNVLVCFLAAFAMVMAGCSCGDDKARMTKEDIKHESYLLNSDDFDLETVIGIVKGNGVKDIETLEKQINDPGSGINNVDVDNDEKIDYIMVKENRDGANYSLEFMAVPSKTGKEDEGNLIASMRIKKSGGNVEVSGGYPDYIQGHDSHHYRYNHHGMGFGQAMFLAYMFSPRAMYYRPYGSFGAYAPRSYMSPSQRTSTRTSYQKSSTTKVSPVKKQAKPSSYKPAKSANKTQSKFNKGGIKSKPGDKSLSSRGGQSKTYNQRNSGKSKKGATGFGSKGRSSSSRSSSSGRSSSSRGGSSKLSARCRKRKVVVC